MSNRNIVITIVIILLVALGIWGVVQVRNNSKTEVQSDNKAADQSQPDQTNNPQDQSKDQSMNDTTTLDNGECKRDFDENKLKTATVDTKNQTVTMEFANFGTVRMQLYDVDAPKTVENFLRLVNAGFYDCLTVHRVAKGFVIQTGDPKGDGTGGQSAFGGDFADELNPSTASFKAGYLKGTLAMANRGPNTNSSQFFITLGDLTSALPKNYTIFGKVTEGMDVVDKIGNVEINPGPFGSTDGAPKVPVIIKKAIIAK